jgi:hypothetical protein
VKVVDEEQHGGLGRELVEHPGNPFEQAVAPALWSRLAKRARLLGQS